MTDSLFDAPARGRSQTHGRRSTQFDTSPEDRHPLWVKTATYPQYPKHVPPCTRLDEAVQASALTGNTVRIYGPHGISKSAATAAQGPKVLESIGIKGAHAIVLNAVNLSPDDAVSAAPVRVTGENGDVQLVLKDVIMSQLVPDKPALLIVDDSLQGMAIVQNQLMQLAQEWSLGSFNLRDHGIVAVVFLDNPELSETMTSVEDIAQLDRFITMEVTDQDTAPAVKLWLAAKHPHRDLTKVFAIRDALPPALRRILSWRTFDHAIDLALNGLPAHWALPYVDGQYKALQDPADKNNVDRTKEVFSKLCNALGVAYCETVPQASKELISKALENNWSIRIVGPPGVGKTELTKAEVRNRGWNLVNMSLPVTDFDAKCSPVPTADGKLKMLLAESLSNPEPKVLLIDEFSRPKDSLSHARGMEVTHDWSLGGEKITNLKAVIALENPPTFLGRKMDVISCNISQADRFVGTVVIDSTDVAFGPWLRTELPQRMAAEFPDLFGHRTDEIAHVAEIVTTWHSEDLDEEGRQWVSPRNLERIIRSVFADAALESTLVWMGPGEHAPVSLSQLHARLSDKPVTGIRELTQNLDDWIERLTHEQAMSDIGSKYSDAVHLAFTNADTAVLVEHKNTVVNLVQLLPMRYRLTYFSVRDTERQTFWMQAISEGADIAAKRAAASRS